MSSLANKTDILLLAGSSGYPLWSSSIKTQIVVCGYRDHLAEDEKTVKVRLRELSSLEVGKRDKEEGQIAKWREKDSQVGAFLFKHLNADVQKMMKEWSNDVSALDIWKEVKSKFSNKSEDRLVIQLYLLNHHDYNPATDLGDWVAEIQSMIVNYIEDGGSLGEEIKLRTLKGLLGAKYDDFKSIFKTLPKDEQTAEQFLLQLEDRYQRDLLSISLASSAKTLSISNSSTSSSKGSTKKPKIEKKFETGCWECGGAHARHFCPKLSKEGKVKKGNNPKGKVNAAIKSPELDFECDSEGEEVCRSNHLKSLHIASSATKSHSWLLDSGSNEHVTSRSHLLSSPLESKASISGIIAGVELETSLMGNVVLATAGGSNVVLKDVLQSDAVSENIISVPKLVKEGATVIMGPEGGKVVFGKVEMKIAVGSVVINASQTRDGFFLLSDKSKSTTYSTRRSASVIEWHERLGHASLRRVKDTAKMVDDMVITGRIPNNLQCASCEVAKSTTLPFPSSKTRASRPLESLHADLAGPYENLSKGKSYLLVITDDYSRYREVIQLALKSDTFEAVTNWVKQQENLLQHKVAKFRSDKGGEFVGQCWDEWMAERGITRNFSMTQSSGQNGVAERSIRIVKEGSRAMLLAANLGDKNLGGYAAEDLCYSLNRRATSILDNMTPFEAFFGKKPSVNLLIVFGSTAFVNIPKGNRNKASTANPRGQEGKVIGVSKVSKGWIVMMNDGKIIESHDVRFWGKDDDPEPELIEEEELPLPVPPRNQVPEVPQDDSEPEGPEERHYPARDHQMPERYRTNRVARVLQAKISGEVIPSGRRAAISGITGKKWIAAETKELSTLKEKQVFEIVDHPGDKKILPAFWIYDLKKGKRGETIYDENGLVDGQKAQLVAGGNHQIKGIDFGLSYAPVSSYSFIRMIVSEAAQPGWHMYGADVKGAYLNAEMDRDLYLRIPESNDEVLEKARRDGKVWKAIKALYGLVQSGRLWYEHLRSILRSLEYQQSKLDRGIFYIREGDSILYLPIYVDDLLAATNSENLWNQLVRSLEKVVVLSKAGPLDYHLGALLEKTKSGAIIISQSAYITEIIKRFGMEDASSVVTPLLAGSHPRREGQELISVTKSEFQELLGMLNWVVNISRPDLTYAVRQLGRFQANPMEEHWEMGKRIVRYLTGTRTFGIKFEDDGKTLQGFSDSDWAGDPDSRYSRSGGLIWRNGPIEWTSSLQKVLTHSSTEAEYVALSSLSRDLDYFKDLSIEIHLQNIAPIIVHSDNTSAIHLSESEAINSRNRHMDIRLHHIRELVVNGTIAMQHISTDDNPSDIFTKSLGKEKFTKFRNLIGVVDCREEMGEPLH